ncbi:hypothetical protein [Lactobacillus sp. PSON]|uniref:hypothetical protein n=1 Tax=Lactobacillus sp. PSON TaxID=3455454 RepID=UPI0040434587
MKDYEVIFVKAIMSKNYGIAEESLKKLAAFHKMSIREIYMSLLFAGVAAFEDNTLNRFLENIDVFEKQIIVELKK